MITHTLQPEITFLDYPN